MPETINPLDLVGEIYDCAITPAGWPDTLARVVKYVGGSCAGITVQDPMRRQIRLLTDWGTDPKYMKSYRDEYYALNPAFTTSWYMNPGEPYTSTGIVGRDEFFASRFYREWCKPQQYRDAVCVLLAKSASRFGALTIVRGDRQGDISPDVVERVRLIGPHIKRAVLIGDMLEAQGLKAEMLSSTLDMLSIGIFLLDARGRIVHANGAGARMLEAKTALRSDREHLSAVAASSSAMLVDAITRAACGDAESLGGSGIAVPITNSDGPDLAAWVLPLDGGLRLELAAPFAASVAVFVRPIGDTSAFPGELFVRHYGITQGECRVLMLLSRGMTVRDVGDALGISEATTKTHVSRLLSKTGTQRQADLIRLVTSALAPVARPASEDEIEGG